MFFYKQKQLKKSEIIKNGTIYDICQRVSPEQIVNNNIKVKLIIQ